MRKQQAKITPAYNLPCKYVLHTEGPIIRGSVTQEDETLLASCYRSCLELAEQNGIKSIAFCCISTGEFHFPSDRAAEITVRTVKEYRAQIFRGQDRFHRSLSPFRPVRHRHVSGQ